MFYNTVRDLAGGQALPQLDVTSGLLAPRARLEAARQGAREDDGFLLLVCLQGSGAAVGGGGVVALAAGQAVLLPAGGAEPVALRGEAVGLALRLDRQTAKSLVPAVASVLLRPTAPGDPAVRLLAAYCQQLLALGALSPSLALLCGAHVRALIGHLYAAAGDGAPAGAIRSARLRAVLRAMAERFREPDLTAAAVGDRLGVSGRYVQQLLERAGLTFSAQLRSLRIEEAARLLRDPGWAHRRICEIAYAVGFQDVSYFNREFRLRVGVTPSQARRAAARADQPKAEAA